MEPESSRNDEKLGLWRFGRRLGRQAAPGTEKAKRQRDSRLSAGDIFQDLCGFQGQDGSTYLYFCIKFRKK